MALETLKGVDKIGGFNVVVMDDLREKYPDKFIPSGQMNWKWFEKDIRPNHFIYLRHDKNSLSFTLQNGPIKEAGVNGCQVDTLIHAAKAIIDGLDAKFPCSFNQQALAGLSVAIAALRTRTEDRESRGVEGYNKT